MKTHFQFEFVNRKMIKRTLLPLVVAAVCGFQQPVFGQKPVVIKLDNPSFEDFPQAGHCPQGWSDCGFAGETPPDVQPSGSFSVNKPAAHGSTYLGMVVRDNNTWERVSQRLKSPLLKGVTYTFSIFLCRSELYMSVSHLTNRDANYITPATLRIWAGNDYCTEEELLAETAPIAVGTWQKFDFKFTPKTAHSHIVFEAFYKVPTLFPYNGNILLDNASDIVPEIKKEPTIAAVPKPKPPTPKPVTPPKKTDTPSVVVVKPKPKPEEPKVVVEEPKVIFPDKLREGQTIRIEKLQFSAQSSVIDESSFSELDKIYHLLADNPNLIVEIGGHTNLVISDDAMSFELSTRRAKAVAYYLIKKGIEKKRLQVKGYGKSQPIENATTQAANKLNQRVELKILSTNG